MRSKSYVICMIGLLQVLKLVKVATDQYSCSDSEASWSYMYYMILQEITAVQPWGKHFLQL